MSAGFARIWGWPLAIAAVSASGLVSALLFDGWGDVWSWLALAVPAGVCAWGALPRPPEDHPT